MPRSSAIDESPTPSTRSSRNSTASPSNTPAVIAEPARAPFVGGSPRFDTGREPAHREADPADPRERGETERDDDQTRT